MRTDRRKRSRRKKRILGTFLFILMTAGAVIVYSQTNLFGGEDSTDPAQNIKESGPPAVEGSPAEVDDEQQTEETPEESLNFLLVGVDDKESGAARTDTIMLANLKPTSGEVKLASIMRDTYVEIPGHQNNKINASFSFGGIDLLKETVEDNFNIPIDYYATVNFDGFVEVVDTLAPKGLEIEIEDRMYYSDHSGDVYIDFQPGNHNLDGEETLNYVRYRSDHENDFGRVRRQQEILRTLKDKLFSASSVVKVPQLIGAIRPNLDTDVSTSKMIGLGKDIMLHPVDHIDTMRIPTEDAYTDQRYSHAGAVLEPDLEKNRQILHEFFELEMEHDSIVSSSIQQNNLNTSP
ncbi:LCP family protein [Alteribacillus iranensis]|uniref:Cell envelope-related function transcriptional attenuator common domain-containing protein n=1 Tax=Alteribacillus iranensis TaxID=930128 RepID=A0A1I2CXU7_9BACI|nr:LCP family protein [Alteribacillus iranensis]SFE73106.1 cell envelope-related function transcriptional attenuator common domain-containing protein [Alteribacillus iranensis]